MSWSSMLPLLVPLLLVILGVSFTSAGTEHHHHYNTDFCVGKADGEYAHPNSCPHFIHCSHQVAHVKPCSDIDKLVFDPNLRVCVWKTDYNCRSGMPGSGSGGSGGSPGKPSKATRTAVTYAYATVGLLALPILALKLSRYGD